MISIVRMNAMQSITITCPSDGTEFAVVEPESRSSAGSFSVTCPSCQVTFPVVYPTELSSSDSTRSPMVPYDDGEIIEWEQHPDGPKPYSGSDKQIPFEQYVRVTIGGIGGDLYGMVEEPSVDEQVVSGSQDRFQIWYTPDHDTDGQEQVAYVVRADRCQDEERLHGCPRWAKLVRKKPRCPARF